MERTVGAFGRANASHSQRRSLFMATFVSWPLSCSRSRLWFLDRQLAAIDCLAVSDVERAVICSSEDARRDGLIPIRLWQDAAGTAGWVEDLHAEVARDVEAARLCRPPCHHPLSSGCRAGRR